MNLFRHFTQEVSTICANLEALKGQDISRLTVEAPRDTSHGDITTNAAMVLCKGANMKPRDLAEIIKTEIEKLDGVRSAEIAGPGFINCRLDNGFWHRQLAEILKLGTDYGTSDIGAGHKVNVEYVSANPTGPMHVGHGRGAVFGDVLASLLEKAGFDVCREYYINDAGAQVDVLARSLYLRYLQALGDEIGEIPEGLYPGDYLVPVGQALAKRDGEKWKGMAEDKWLLPIRDFAISAMMDLIREDLGALGVKHDVFTSEHKLVSDGKVDEAINFLKENNLIYQGVLEPPKGQKPDDWEMREQTLFKATEFGDDVDRPVQKSDGSWTYFASDMACHMDKYNRGFADMIDVWGADHGGYVKRMQAAVKALSNNKGSLDVKLCQMVNLMDAGEPVKMSKRAGTFVTLRDVIDEVGKDVVRFIMLTRKNDAGLDFDFSKVREQSKDNPVFYVQYAHARSYSVLRMAAEELGEDAVRDDKVLGGDLSLLVDESEIALIRLMAAWPRLVESAAEAHEPHRMAFYMYDLAAEFHQLWNKGKDDASLRFIIKDDVPLTMARLALVRALGSVIASGFGVFGVTPKEEMR
ncbi:MAG: arginine--tRNA ligase [Rhodospirillaceae bacterium]|nr:arginine--tRNA ligase [Rhodospirillaceae bacterium]